MVSSRSASQQRQRQEDASDVAAVVVVVMVVGAREKQAKVFDPALSSPEVQVRRAVTVHAPRSDVSPLRLVRLEEQHHQQQKREEGRVGRGLTAVKWDGRHLPCLAPSCDPGFGLGLGLGPGLAHPNPSRSVHEFVELEVRLEVSLGYRCVEVAQRVPLAGRSHDGVRRASRDRRLLLLLLRRAGRLRHLPASRCGRVLLRVAWNYRWHRTRTRARARARSRHCHLQIRWARQQHSASCPVL